MELAFKKDMSKFIQLELFSLKEMRDRLGVNDCIKNLLKRIVRIANDFNMFLVGWDYKDVKLFNQILSDSGIVYINRHSHDGSVQEMIEIEDRECVCKKEASDVNVRMVYKTWVIRNMNGMKPQYSDNVINF